MGVRLGQGPVRTRAAPPLATAPALLIGSVPREQGGLCHRSAHPDGLATMPGLGFPKESDARRRVRSPRPVLALEPAAHRQLLRACKREWNPWSGNATEHCKPASSLQCSGHFTRYSASSDGESTTCQEIRGCGGMRHSQSLPARNPNQDAVTAWEKTLITR